MQHGSEEWIVGVLARNPRQEARSSEGRIDRPSSSRLLGLEQGGQGPGRERGRPGRTWWVGVPLRPLERRQHPSGPPLQVQSPSGRVGRSCERRERVGPAGGRRRGVDVYQPQHAGQLTDEDLQVRRAVGQHMREGHCGIGPSHPDERQDSRQGGGAREPRFRQQLLRERRLSLRSFESGEVARAGVEILDAGRSRHPGQLTCPPLRLSWRQEPPRVGQLDNGQGREGGILRIDVEPRYVLQCRDELGLNFQHVLKRSHRFAPRASHERSPMQQLVGEPELAEEKIFRASCQRLQGVESGRQGQALRPNQSLVLVRKVREVGEVVHTVSRVVFEVEPAANLAVPPITQPARRVERCGLGVTRSRLAPASAREGALRTLEGGPP